MNTTDPIADMLTRIRNAIMARHDTVLIPVSRMKLAIAKILKEEGFIIDYALIKGSPHGEITIFLKYSERNRPVLAGLERVSKPGLRVYVQKKEIPRIYGGLGTAIISTARGVMTGQKAWRQGIGGEYLCCIW
ncbi:30S ribosomal protein S8 [Chloroflexota bacterium]